MRYSLFVLDVTLCDMNFFILEFPILTLYISIALGKIASKNQQKKETFDFLNPRFVNLYHKTPLVVRISICTVFLGPKIRTIRGEDSL